MSDVPQQLRQPDVELAGDCDAVDVGAGLTGLSTLHRFATGFDTMTGALSEVDIRGRAGVAPMRRWAE